jgi:hypothetical protein
MLYMRQGGVLATALMAVVITAGCGAPATNTMVANTNVNSNTNLLSNTNLNNTTTNTTAITTGEPEQYQANVRLTLQAVGETQTANMPALGAVVARSGADRVMEFALPTGEKVIYLDKGGMNYLILPNRKQYAELTKEAIGFEVRRLLMPEQIVQQVKAIPGIRLAGEETLNGRTVVKYVYSGAAQTATQAGTVATESYVLVDKETGLPVRSETLSQSQSGGNVQGYKGLRVLTEMTDIKTNPDANIFTVPAEFQKIDAEQVKAQATAIFQVVGQLVGQMIQQSSQPQPATSPTASPMASPVR